MAQPILPQQVPLSCNSLCSWSCPRHTLMDGSHQEDVQLNMPKLRDTPEMWAMWIDQNPDKCLRGIVVMPDGHVSMRGI